MIADTPPASENEIASVRDYARCRLVGLFRSPAVRREVALVVALLVALFALPFASWNQRWTLPASPQGYALFTLPLALVWLWIARTRLVLPELDSLNERFSERSVLRFLLEEKPEPPRRLLWVFGLGCALTVFALWTGEPSLTATAFVVLMVGIVGFRHGTQALRAAAFPLAFLTTLIPLPGLLTDPIAMRMQVVLFKIATHVFQIIGIKAELALEGDALWVSSHSGASYQLFAGQAGVGLSEAGLFLLLLVWVLSLLNVRFRVKLAALAFGVLWMASVLIARIMVLGWVGGMESDMAGALMLPTRWLIPVAGAAGQYLILRALRCLRWQEWISLRREGKTPALEVPLYSAPGVRKRAVTLLSATAALGLAATLVLSAQAARQKPPIPPARVDAWQGEEAIPPPGAAQRGHPLAVYRKYIQGERTPIFISIARATTLNDFRAPSHYLLGPDGLLMNGQEALIPRTGEKQPVRQLAIARDRNDPVLLMHWAQAPGGDPFPDPTETPSRIAGVLLSHSALYICDIWMAPPAEADWDRLHFTETLIHFADLLDAQIRSMGHK